jgi:hypothetical protein
MEMLLELVLDSVVLVLDSVVQDSQYRQELAWELLLLEELAHRSIPESQAMMEQVLLEFVGLIRWWAQECGRGGCWGSWR